MKFLYILRSVPGAGKTTLAESLDAVICSADDFMVDVEGNYSFNVDKLSECHDKCYNKAKESMVLSKPKIVIANTNIRVRDVRKYKELGEIYGYKVFILTVENWHDNTNVHDVPETKLQEFENSLRQTIKLR